jgi:hypothetical protein
MSRASIFPPASSYFDAHDSISGTWRMSDALLIENRKLLLDSGPIVQIRIWQLSEPAE